MCPVIRWSAHSGQPKLAERFPFRFCDVCFVCFEAQSQNTRTLLPNFLIVCPPDIWTSFITSNFVSSNTLCTEIMMSDMDVTITAVGYYSLGLSLLPFYFKTISHSPSEMFLIWYSKVFYSLINSEILWPLIGFLHRFPFEVISNMFGMNFGFCFLYFMSSLSLC